jgi:hypothetical protein
LVNSHDKPDPPRSDPAQRRLVQLSEAMKEAALAVDKRALNL